MLMTIGPKLKGTGTFLCVKWDGGARGGGQGEKQTCYEVFPISTVTTIIKRSSSFKPLWNLFILWLLTLSDIFPVTNELDSIINRKLDKSDYSLYFVYKEGH